MVFLIFFGIITQNKLNWILFVIITINSNQNNYATSNFTPPISSKMLKTWTKTKKITRGHNSKTWPDWAKPMWFLDSAHQIHPKSTEKPHATIFLFTSVIMFLVKRRMHNAFESSWYVNSVYFCLFYILKCLDLNRTFSSPLFGVEPFSYQNISQNNYL